MDARPRGEGIHIGALDAQLFDVLARRGKIKAVGRFVEDLPERVQHLVDPCSRQRFLAPRSYFAEFGAVGKYVSLGDLADRLLPEAGNQAVEFPADGDPVGLAPLHLLLQIPGLREVLEEGRRGAAARSVRSPSRRR
jgi:hypothetical protein